MNILALGFPQHGKTTYINSLCMTVENLAKILPASYYQIADQYTLDTFRKARRQFSENTFSPSTEISSVIPPLSINFYIDGKETLLKIHNLEDSILDKLDYDFAERTGILKQTTVFWFFVSITELTNDAYGRSLSDVIQVILPIFDRLGIQTQGLELAIIYTKADQLIDKLPTEVIDYLASDPYDALITNADEEFPQIDLDAYRQKTLAISDHLGDYTRNQLAGGATIANIAKSRSMNLTYFVVSALGQSPSDGYLHAQIRPYRVLDPLIWSLKLDRSNETSSIMPITDQFDTKQRAKIPPNRTIFISYRRTDEVFARKIYNELTDKGFTVWLDVVSIRAGEDWSDAIHHGLTTSDIMLLIITPDAMSSKNVADEWKYFHSRNRPIIPIRLRRVDNLHYQLNRLQYIDFEDQEFDSAIEKLAAEINHVETESGNPVD